MHVVIVGGGISGLAAAEELLRLDADIRVTLLEREPALGGMIGSERHDGYLLEQGPDAIVASKPEGRALCARLGIGHRLEGTVPARPAFVLRRGSLRPLPSGLSGLVPAQLGALLRSPLLSRRGRLRAAAEPFLRQRNGGGEESVESFVTRRLGREMYDWLVEPLLSGIYAGDGGMLSISAAFPQLAAWEARYGSLLRGARHHVRAPGPAFVSLPGGLGELVSALETALRRSGRIDIRRETAVTRIGTRPGGRPIVTAGSEPIDADAVILATSARAAGTLSREVAPALADALRAIPVASVSIVTLGCDAAAIRRPLDASGYVVPRAEGRPVLACTWSSAKFGGRAPSGKALLRVFIGGAGRGDAALRDDDWLIDTARREVAEVLGAEGAPELIRVHRWTDAMPQYIVGHAARLGRVKESLTAHPWLALAGNFREGVGIPDCIRSGQHAARGLIRAVTPALPV